MISLTVYGPKQLISDEDIFDIKPFNGWREILEDKHSLCMVWNPEFKGFGPNLKGLRGKFIQRGQPTTYEMLYYTTDPDDEQSRTKNWLDHCLITPYLFSSWKKNGIRTFKIIHNGQAVFTASNIVEALHYLTGGVFIPKAFYHRKYTLMGFIPILIKRRMEHRDLCKRLVNALDHRKKLLEDKASN